MSNQEKQKPQHITEIINDPYFHYQVDKRARKSTRTFLIASLGILTLGGVFTFSGMRTSIENTVASRLASDPAIQTQVVEKVQVQLTEVEQVIEKARQLTIDIQKEREEASEILKNNLDDILDKVQQIKEELSEIEAELSEKSLESTESNKR